jgi:hypothetical protein
MKTKLSIFLVALVLAAASNIQAAETHHHHHAAEPAKLQLNAGKKWATDAPLRQAMNDINQAMAKALPAIHKNQFGNEDYQALAATISARVGDAVAQCKLEPKADAMLHLIIADLMSGAEIMEGKSSQTRHDGAVKVLEALKSYGKYFQHPAWNVAKG